MEQKVKVAIIGSGPAGYSAGIYSARSGHKPLIITGKEFGGQITKTFDLENYPGFTEKIDGIYLTEQMRQQAEIFGATILADIVINVDFKTQPFKLYLESKNIILADSIIIATGSSYKTLGLYNENKLTGHGISYCATCDGFFFRDKEVFVIGGGNTAIYEALHLSSICKKITIVHRKDIFTAEKINQDHLFNMPNISVIWNNSLEEIIENNNKVIGVKLKNTKTGESSEYKTQGIFIAIGNKPNTEIFKGQINLTTNGYIETKPNLSETNIPGIFAAGDVKNPNFKQVIIACGSGAQSAMEVDKYLLGKE